MKFFGVDLKGYGGTAGGVVVAQRVMRVRAVFLIVIPTKVGICSIFDGDSGVPTCAGTTGKSGVAAD